MKPVGDTDNKVLSNLVTHVAQLTKQLGRHQSTTNSIQTSPWELCEFGEGEHNSAECQSGQQTVEHAQYVSRFNQPQQQGQYGSKIIRTKIKAKVGVIIRTIRAIRVTDGETIRTTCHYPE